MLAGRSEIYTDVPEITSGNVIDVLMSAISTHRKNAKRINFLLNYDAGIQPIVRQKKYRPEINCKCEDNVANEITEFNLGFKWGYPITMVQRDGTEKDIESEAISLLNECYDAENIKAKTQKLGRFVEIASLAYTYVDINTEWEDGDSYFKIEALDPRTTFVVKSSYYIDERVMLGVTYRKDEKGNYFYTCFSKNRRYEIKNNEGNFRDSKKWNHLQKSGEENPLHLIPIIEWIRSYDRMGCFERQISEMDNLNLLISDFTNDVEQNTQAVWHANDVEFPTETVELEDGTTEERPKKPKDGEWLGTKTPQDGKTPFVKPLVLQYDYTGMLNNIVTRRSLILQKCNVPQRNDNSGGSTGIAMSDATGWSAAETAACKQQNIMEASKMQEIKVVLAAIRKNPYIKEDNPLLKLKYSDIQPNIKRQKTYEMTTKANAFATWVSHGINGLHALKAINGFEDVNQVWEDSRETIEAYQKHTFNENNANAETAPNADRLMQDESDQIENSPSLKG